MVCRHCGSERILSVYAKCSDRCQVIMGDIDEEGYVPEDLGIGGGDCVHFDMCLDCGMNQNEFPLAPTLLEVVPTDQEVIDFFVDSGFDKLTIKELNKYRWDLYEESKHLGVKFQTFIKRLMSLSYGNVLIDANKLLDLFKMYG